MKAIKKQNFSTYVNFANNFNKAEEEEKAGNLKIALINYKKALENLEAEEKQDELIQETMEEVKAKIAELEEKH